jgi:hypothetical protein
MAAYQVQSAVNYQFEGEVGGKAFLMSKAGGIGINLVRCVMDMEPLRWNTQAPCLFLVLTLSVFLAVKDKC